MKYRWVLHPSLPAGSETLVDPSQLLPPLALQCLANRGIADSRSLQSFLQPRLRELSDPFLLPQMDRAVDRLFMARSKAEPFVIFGDYDVDGVTATGLLTMFFKRLGWKCHSYLPHRMEEGYGLSQEGVDRCLEKYPVKLLLAVDCGSTARQVIETLKARGVDVLVLDHHQISNPAPEPVALVNPHLPSTSVIPFKDYCSAGLAFKLAHAILKRARENPVWQEAHDCDLRDYLDLVALGTVADMVPLLGENRTFVKVGLEKLSESSRPGIRALKKVAGISGAVGAYQVGFGLAPRLNAAGRLESALDALNLLLAESGTEAEMLAERLNRQNQERQSFEQSIFEEVKAAVMQRFDPARDHVIVAGEAGWHIGVVGIVASRILREFHRPVVVFGCDGGTEWRGSGRSMEGIDLAAAFQECAELLVKHGGHAMAAGLSIQPALLDCFREKLNSIVQQKNCPDLFQPKLRIDAEASFAELTPKTFEALECLAPFGQGNPQVQLSTRNVRLCGGIQRFGNEKKHARFHAEDGAARHQVIWWNFPSNLNLSRPFDLAFVPEINEYNGERFPRLKAIDFQQT
ncbi:MAG: single-stranded-DNA-specific exonuclease RecJ [Verrucomicrobiales bacterium]